MKFMNLIRNQLLLLLIPAAAAFSQSLIDTLDSPLDGQVNAVIVNGTKIYMGGSFTKIGYSTGPGALLDTATALPDRTFPKFDPMEGLGTYLFTSAPDGSGGWYVGGQFKYINGVLRKYLAHIRADHTLDPWDPEPNSFVKAICVTGSRVYIGGVFDSVAGQQRGYAAAFNKSDGSLLPWNPQADNVVTALQEMGQYVYIGGYFYSLHSQTHLAIGSVDTVNGNPTNWSFYNTVPSFSGYISSFIYTGGYLYAAGLFSMIDSVNRLDLVKFDQAGNVVMNWNPGATLSGGGDYATVLAVSGSNVFVGGSFTSIGGRSVTNLAAIDTGTGLASAWSPNPNNNVASLAVCGSKLYVGGPFTSIGGRSISYLAAIDTSTGNATTWDAKLDNYPWTILPSVGSIFAGGYMQSAGSTTRKGLACIDFATGRLTSWNPNATGGQVHAIVIASDKLIAGGEFTNVGASNLSIPYLAAFDTTSGNPIQSPTWQGRAGGIVRSLLVMGNRLYVGGDFFSLDLNSRSYLGAIDKTTGILNPWHPTLDNGGVWSMASSGTKVFVSGFFSNINGTARGYAAAFDTTNDLLTSWDPEPDNFCYALATLGNKVYLGGQLFSVDGNSSVKSLAAVDTSSGALFPGFNSNFALALSVYAIAAIDTDLIIGGQMSSSYSPNRSALAYLNPNTGSVEGFNSHMNEDIGTATVYSLALGNHTLVVGGQFLNANYFPQANLLAYLDSSIVVGPKLKIVPDTISFGYVLDGQHKDTTVTLENIGSADLNITSVTSTSPEFSITPTSVTIPAGGSVSDSIKLTASGTTHVVALLLYSSNCPTNPDTVWVDARPESPLPVEVTSFSASTGEGQVVISWKTQSEVDIAGFNIMRLDPGAASFKLISGYTSNDRLKGLGTSPTGRSYQYSDTKVASGGKYEYKLLSVSTDGSVNNLNTISVIVDVPKEYALYQNYPNPFNPSTNVRFDLKETSSVKLIVFNSIGQQVSEYDLGQLEGGRYAREIDMSRYASGVYYFKIDASGTDGQHFTSIKKMVLMK
ncbi:MAG TPA: T9SS type A sorting domain-containing protein [Candidatus Kryptonia bacterium]